MSHQLELRILECRTPHARGVASRFGFELDWSATWDGRHWLVEVPAGHTLGPDGKGAFEIVTDDDWPRWVAAVRREINKTLGFSSS